MSECLNDLSILKVGRSILFADSRRTKWWNRWTFIEWPIFSVEISKTKSKFCSLQKQIIEIFQGLSQSFWYEGYWYFPGKFWSSTQVTRKTIITEDWSWYNRNWTGYRRRSRSIENEVSKAFLVTEVKIYFSYLSASSSIFDQRVPEPIPPNQSNVLSLQQNSHSRDVLESNKKPWEAIDESLACNRSPPGKLTPKSIWIINYDI